MDKIKILNKKHKKSGESSFGKWNLHSYQINENTWVDSFDDMEVGQEYEGVITENPDYNDNFKIDKSSKSKTSDINLDEVNKKLDWIINTLDNYFNPSKMTGHKPSESPTISNDGVDKTDDLPF